MLQVSIHLSKGHPAKEQIAGTITLDDSGTLVARPAGHEYEQLLKNIMAAGANGVAPNDAKKWISNLCYEYNGSALRASRARRTGPDSKKFHGDHDQSTHGNWADGKGGGETKAEGRFFSPLSRAVGSAKQNSAPAKDWVAIISKAQGVTKDELAATGIVDYLKGKGTEKVTKAELEKFASDHAVTITPVILESRDKATPFMNAQTRLEDAGYFVAQDRGAWVLIDREHGDLVDTKAVSPAVKADYEFLRDRLTNTADEKPKYGQYVLPGGENYREHLLTLAGRSPVEQWRIVPSDVVGRDDVHAGEVDVIDHRGRVVYSGMPEDAQTYIEESRQLVKGDNEFRSAHFDRPNIVAHLRLDDRTDVDGNKVLFIEELQSDWAQQGREQGFDKETFTIIDQAGAQRGQFNTREEAEAYLKNPPFFIQPEYSTIKALREGPPSAPFVTETQAWVGLGMKQAMAEAVKGDYAAVAWTTGAQQADRYSLAKQVDSLEYIPSINKLIAWKDRQSAMTETVTPDKLGDYIGKEAARKLLDTPKNASGRHELSGVQLEVGGEGMKAFYDKIVPQVAEKLIRKNDPEAKIDQIKMVFDRLKLPDDKYVTEKTDQQGFYITPKMRERIRQGLSLFERDYHGDHDQSTHGNWATGAGGDVTDSPEFKEWRAKNPDAKETDFVDTDGWKQWRDRLADDEGWSESTDPEGDRVIMRTEKINKLAEHVGVPEGVSIEYKHEPGYEFKVADSEWTAGASYDPSQDKITVYNGAFLGLGGGDDFLDSGLVEHEIMHAKFHRTEKQGNREVPQFFSLLEEERRVWMNKDGLMNEKGEKDFPALAFRQLYYDEGTREALRREDGVTPYSAAYWKKYEEVLADKKADPSSNFNRAVNETLAEMARIGTFKREATVAHLWNKMYNLVQEAAPSSRKQRLKDSGEYRA